MTDPYCMTTCQDFETTVLTLSFWEGRGKQLVSPRKKDKTTTTAKPSNHLFVQGETVKAWKALSALSFQVDRA